MNFKWTWLPVIFFLISCDRDLTRKGHFIPFRETSFFKDQSSARPLVMNTVSREEIKETAPEIESLTRPEVLARGKDRFEIYCSVCHGLAGYGDGMATQRGFPRPPSFHSDELKHQDVKAYFNTETQGKGLMPAYSEMISLSDRWAIAAYIRALQLSQSGRAK